MPTTAPLGQTPRHPSMLHPSFSDSLPGSETGPGLGGAATAVHTGQAPVSTPPPKMPPNMRVCQSFWNNTSWRGNRFSSKGTAEALCPCTVRSWLARGHCVRRAMETQPQVWEGEGGAAAGKAESVQGAEIPSLPTGSPSSPAESQARTCWYGNQIQLWRAVRPLSLWDEPVSVWCGRPARGSPRLEKILRETQKPTQSQLHSRFLLTPLSIPC